jgi:hypothetical protein
MSDAASRSERRWELIRDVLVFQVKLAIDALRDVLLSPLSLAAAALDLLSDRPGRRFRALLALGRESEIRIDLFGAARGGGTRAESAGGRPGAGEAPLTIDAVAGRIERLVVEQYERGGLTASAKDAIDRALDSIARKPG